MGRSSLAHDNSSTSLSERGLIDLTMPMSERTIPFPGHPRPKLEPLSPPVSDALRNTIMLSSISTGTHVDAPSHLVGAGPSIDQIPIERFWRPAVCLDLTGIGPRDTVDLARLRRAGYSPGRVRDAILLLATGWTDYAWQSERLFEDMPVLGEDAAAAIAAAAPAGLGLDFAVDHDDPWANHGILLRADVVLIENLMNLRSLPREGFEVIAFPHRLAGEGAAPARVVANIPHGVW